MRGSTVLLVIVAIIFPPAAVAFISGCGCDLLINILLTILGYIPGHIHAFWLIYKRAKANETYGYKKWSYGGNGTFRPLDGQGPAVVQQPAYYGATAAQPASGY
ncbi:hypothetical protein HYDPIDRAFT_37869 [Hydnomerulius pinastri MD-312]|nr:hypothetical protein HYDPIDRAFT_37869 [Hydnomerulius pinastri MD-312]